MSYKYNCSLCKKGYSRKSSYEKHNIICNFNHRCDLDKQYEYEELDDIPTNKQLICIVAKLSSKINILEQKIENMQKTVGNNNKKIDVINWLNKHNTPIFTFNTWLSEHIEINCTHFEEFMDNQDITTIIETVLNYNFNKHTSLPIISFNHQDKIYIYDNVEEDNITENDVETNDSNIPKWKLIDIHDIKNIIQVIRHKLTNETLKWKMTNLDIFNNNTSVMEKFNKTVIKLMKNIDNSLSNKIKLYLYNKFKRNIIIISE